MWNKNDFKREIHFYALAEGTGHIARIFYITNFIKKYYKNYIVFILNINRNSLAWLDEFLNQTVPYVVIFNLKEIQNFTQQKFYDLILDIRNFKINEIVKFYINYRVLCLDCEYKKNKNYDYFDSLPGVNSKKNIKELLQNFLINPYLTINHKQERKNKKQLLFYAGIQKHQVSNIQKIKNELEIKFSFKKLIQIDSKHFYSLNKFYKILLKSDLIVTYPGLLMYESMLLEKEILAYYIKSKIHNQILNKIKKECKNYLVEELKIHNHTFLYFNFKNFTQEIQFNLWTPYQKILNWLKEHDV